MYDVRDKNKKQINVLHVTINGVKSGGRDDISRYENTERSIALGVET